MSLKGRKLNFTTSKLRRSVSQSGRGDPSCGEKRSFQVKYFFSTQNGSWIMWIEPKKFYSKYFVACTNKHSIVLQTSASRFVSLFLIKQKKLKGSLSFCHKCIIVFMKLSETLYWSNIHSNCQVKSFIISRIWISPSAVLWAVPGAWAFFILF